MSNDINWKTRAEAEWVNLKEEVDISHKEGFKVMKFVKFAAIICCLLLIGLVIFFSRDQSYDLIIYNTHTCDCNEYKVSTRKNMRVLKEWAQSRLHIRIMNDATCTEIDEALQTCRTQL